MKAMVLRKANSPLLLEEVVTPSPQAHEVLIQVSCCAVCRTDLHVVDGELLDPKLPLIPGHEVVGRIVECGASVKGLEKGDRVGVPWLGSTCGACEYCLHQSENLCDKARFTGYTLDGGYAEYLVADSTFCFKIPESFTDENAAPLLCAGLIGYRSLRMAGQGKKLGIYGFGAAAHILTQICNSQNREVYAFTRTGDKQAQEFACSLGAVWAGSSEDTPPVTLDSAIIFAPLGELVPLALRAVKKGGTVVCGGIHMSDIPSFPYSILWGERKVCSVANLTRQDGIEFFELLAQVPLSTHVELFPLEQANEALKALRLGSLTGAAVLSTSLH